MNVEILAPLRERRSRVSFDPTGIVSAHARDAMLEAARWAPSSNNAQPWRFLLTERGTAGHGQLLATLATSNQTWARHAALLMLVAVETERINHDGIRVPNRSALFDVGLAVMALATEATHGGLNLRMMGGFDLAAGRALLPQGLALDAICVIAIGPANDGAHLPPDVRERDARPRARNSVAELLLG